MSLAKSNVPFKATDKEHRTPHPRSTLTCYKEKAFAHHCCFGSLSSLITILTLVQLIMFLNLPRLSVFAAVAAFTSLIHAHPGEEHDATEVVKKATLRHTIADINSYAVGQCVNDVETLDRKQRAMERRMDTFRRLQANRGIVNGKISIKIGQYHATCCNLSSMLTGD